MDLIRRADRECGAGDLAVSVRELIQVVVVYPRSVDVTNINVVWDLVDVLEGPASLGVSEESTCNWAPVLKLAGSGVLNFDAVLPVFPGLPVEAILVKEQVVAEISVWNDLEAFHGAAICRGLVEIAGNVVLEGIEGLDIALINAIVVSRDT